MCPSPLSLFFSFSLRCPSPVSRFSFLFSFPPSSPSFFSLSVLCLCCVVQ
jgi:hypothetical protein